MKPFTLEELRNLERDVLSQEYIDSSNVNVEELSVPNGNEQLSEISIKSSFFNKISDWIYRASTDGESVLPDILVEIENELDDIKQKLKGGFFSFSDDIKIKVAKYWERIYIKAVSSIPHYIKTEDCEYRAKEISVKLEFSVGGDIKFSLTELLKIASGIKISTDVKYILN